MERKEILFADPTNRTEYFEKIFSSINDTSKKLDNNNDFDWEIEIKKLEKIAYDEELTHFVKDLQRTIPDLFSITVKYAFLGRTFVLLLTIFHTYCALPTDQRESFAPFVGVLTNSFNCIVFFYVKYPDWFDESFFPYLQTLCKYLIQMMNIIRVMTLPPGVRLNQETTFFHESSFEFLPKFFHMHYLWILLQDIYYIFLIFQEETSKIGKLNAGKDLVSTALASEYNRVFQQFSKSLEHSVVEWEEYFVTLLTSLQQYPVNLSPLLPNYATVSSSSSSSSIPPCSILASFTSIPLYEHIYQHYLHHYIPNTRLWILDHLESWRLTSKEFFHKKYFNGELLGEESMGKLFWLQAPKGAGKSTILAAYIQQILAAYVTTANYSLLQHNSLPSSFPGKSYVRTSETIILYAFLSCSGRNTNNPIHNNPFNQQTIDERSNVIRDVLQSISVQLLQYYPILLPSFLPILHTVTNQMTDLFSPWNTHNATRVSPTLQTAHELIPLLPSYSKVVHLIELFISGILQCPYIAADKLLIIVDNIDCIHDPRQLSVLYTLIVNLAKHFRIIVSSTVETTASSTPAAMLPVKKAYRAKPKKEESRFTINDLLTRHLSIHQKFASPYYQEVTEMNEFQALMQLSVEFPVEHYVMALDSFATEYIEEDLAVYLMKQFHSLIGNAEIENGMSPNKASPRYLNPTLSSPYTSQKITMANIQSFLRTFIPTFLHKYRQLLPMHYVEFLSTFPVFRSFCKEIILKGIKEAQGLNTIHNNDEEAQRKLSLFYKKEIVTILGHYRQNQLPLQASQHALPSISITESDVDEGELYSFYLKLYKKKFTAIQWERIMSILGIIVYAYAPMTIDMIYELLALQLPGHGSSNSGSVHHSSYHVSPSSASHHSSHHSVVSSDVSSRLSLTSNTSSFHSKQSSSPPAKPFVFGMATYRNTPISPHSNAQKNNNNNSNKDGTSNNNNISNASVASRQSQSSQHSYFSYNSHYTSFTQGAQPTISSVTMQKNKSSIVEKSHLFVDYKTVFKHITGDLSPLLYIRNDPYHQHVQYVEFYSQHFKGWFKNPLLNKEFYIPPNHVHQQYFIKAAVPLLEFQTQLFGKNISMLISSAATKSVVDDKKVRKSPATFSVNSPQFPPKTPLQSKIPSTPYRNKSPNKAPSASSIKAPNTKTNTVTVSSPSIMKEIAQREARRLTMQNTPFKTPVSKVPKTPTVCMDLSNFSFAKPTASSSSKITEFPSSKTTSSSVKKINEKFEKTRNFFENGDKSPVCDVKTQVTNSSCGVHSVSKHSPNPVILFYLLNYFIYHLGAAGQYEDCMVFYTVLSWNIGLIARKGLLGVLHDIEILYNQLTASLDVVMQQLDKLKVNPIHLVDSKDYLVKSLQEIKHLYGFYLYFRKCCPQYVHKFGVEDVNFLLEADFLRDNKSDGKLNDKKRNDRASQYQYYVLCHQFCLSYIHYFHCIVKESETVLLMNPENTPKKAEKPPPPPTSSPTPSSPKRKAGNLKTEERVRKEVKEIDIDEKNSKNDTTKERFIHLKYLLTECTQWLQHFGFLQPVPSFFSSPISLISHEPKETDITPLSSSKETKKPAQFSACIVNTVADSLVCFSLSGSLLLFRSKSLVPPISPGGRLQRSKSFRTMHPYSDDDYFLWDIGAQKIVEYYVDSYLSKYQQLFCTDDSLLGAYTTFSGSHSGLITIEIWDSIYQGKGTLIQMISSPILNPMTCIKFLNSFYLFLQDSEGDCMVWNYYSNSLSSIPNAMKQKDLLTPDQIFFNAPWLIILSDEYMTVIRVQDINYPFGGDIATVCKIFSLCAEGRDVMFLSKDHFVVGTLDSHIYLVDLKMMSSIIIYRPINTDDLDSIVALQSICYSATDALLFVGVSREINKTSLLMFSFCDQKSLVRDPNPSKILKFIAEMEVDFVVKRMKAIEGSNYLLLSNDNSTVYWQYEIQQRYDNDELISKDDNGHKNTVNVLSFIGKNCQLFNKVHSHHGTERELIKFVQFIDADHIFEVTSRGQMMIWNISHNVCVRQLVNDDYAFEGCKIIPLSVESHKCYAILTWHLAGFDKWLFCSTYAGLQNNDLNIVENDVSFSSFSIISTFTNANSPLSVSSASLDATTNHVKFSHSNSLQTSSVDGVYSVENTTVVDQGSYFIIGGTYEGQLLVYDFRSGQLVGKQTLLYDECVLNILAATESSPCVEFCHLLVATYDHVYRISIDSLNSTSSSPQPVMLIVLDVMKYPCHYVGDHDYETDPSSSVLSGFFHLVPSNPTLSTRSVDTSRDVDNIESRYIVDRVLSVWDNVIIGWDQLQTEDLIVQARSRSNDMNFSFFHHHLHYPPNKAAPAMNLTDSTIELNRFEQSCVKDPRKEHNNTLRGHKEHPYLPTQHGVHNPFSGTYHAAVPEISSDDVVTSQVAVYRVVPPLTYQSHINAFRVKQAQLIFTDSVGENDEYLLLLQCIDMHILIVDPWTLTTVHSFPPGFDFASYFFHTIYPYSLNNISIGCSSNNLNVWEHMHVHGRTFNWIPTGDYLLEFDPVLHNYTIHKISKDKLEYVDMRIASSDSALSPGNFSQLSTSPFRETVSSPNSSQISSTRPPKSPMLSSPIKLLNETNKWLSAFSLFLQTDRQETMKCDDGRKIVLVDVIYLPYCQANNNEETDEGIIDMILENPSLDSIDRMEIDALFPAHSNADGNEDILQYSEELLQPPKNDGFVSEPAAHLRTFLQPFVVPLSKDRRGHRSLAPLTSLTPTNSDRKTVANEETPSQKFFDSGASPLANKKDRANLRASKIPRRIKNASAIKQTEQTIMSMHPASDNFGFICDLVTKQHSNETFSNTASEEPMTVEPHEVQDCFIPIISEDLPCDSEFSAQPPEQIFLEKTSPNNMEVNSGDSCIPFSNNSSFQKNMNMEFDRSFYIPHEVNNSPDSSPRPRKINRKILQRSVDTSTKNFEYFINSTLSIPFENNDADSIFDDERNEITSSTSNYSVCHNLEDEDADIFDEFDEVDSFDLYENEEQDFVSQERMYDSPPMFVVNNPMKHQIYKVQQADAIPGEVQSISLVTSSCNIGDIFEDRAQYGTMNSDGCRKTMDSKDTDTVYGLEKELHNCIPLSDELIVVDGKDNPTTEKFSQCYFDENEIVFNSDRMQVVPTISTEKQTIPVSADNFQDHQIIGLSSASTELFCLNPTIDKYTLNEFSIDPDKTNGCDDRVSQEKTIQEVVKTNPEIGFSTIPISDKTDSKVEDTAVVKMEKKDEILKVVSPSVDSHKLRSNFLNRSTETRGEEIISGESEVKQITKTFQNIHSDYIRDIVGDNSVDVNDADRKLNEDTIINNSCVTGDNQRENGKGDYKSSANDTGKLEIHSPIDQTILANNQNFSLVGDESDGFDDSPNFREEIHVSTENFSRESDSLSTEILQNTVVIETTSIDDNKIRSFPVDDTTNCISKNDTSLPRSVAVGKITTPIEIARKTESFDHSPIFSNALTIVGNNKIQSVSANQEAKYRLVNENSAEARERVAENKNEFVLLGPSIFIDEVVDAKEQSVDENPTLEESYKDSSNVFVDSDNMDDTTMPRSTAESQNAVVPKSEYLSNINIKPSAVYRDGENVVVPKVSPMKSKLFEDFPVSFKENEDFSGTLDGSPSNESSPVVVTHKASTNDNSDRHCNCVQSDEKIAVNEFTSSADAGLLVMTLDDDSSIHEEVRTASQTDLVSSTPSSSSGYKVSFNCDEFEDELEKIASGEKDNLEGPERQSVELVVPTFRRSVSWDNSTFTSNDHEFINVRSILSTPSQATILSNNFVPSAQTNLAHVTFLQAEDEENEDANRSIPRTLSYDNTTITTAEFMPNNISLTSTPTIGTIESFDGVETSLEGVQIDANNKSSPMVEETRILAQASSPSDANSPRIPFMIPMSTTTIMSELFTPETTTTLPDNYIFPVLDLQLPYSSPSPPISRAASLELPRSLSQLPQSLRPSRLQLSSSERSNIHRFLDQCSRKERRKRRVFLSVLYGIPDLQLDSDHEGRNSDDDESDDSSGSGSEDDEGEEIVDNAWLATSIDSTSKDDQQPRSTLQSTWAGAVSPYYLGLYQQAHRQPSQDIGHMNSPGISPTASLSPHSQAATPRIISIHGPASYPAVSPSSNGINRLESNSTSATPAVKSNRFFPLTKNNSIRKAYSSSKHHYVPIQTNTSYLPITTPKSTRNLSNPRTSPSPITTLQATSNDSP